MKSNVTKVVIVGAGAVGATVAFSLVVKGVAAEVTLIDINRQKAQGEIWDMQHSMDFQTRNVRVTLGDYASCKDADIVVITASAPFSGETSRLDMLHKSANIMRAIIPPIMQSGFDGIFIVVSNPVDIMTYLVRELSGFPKGRVIGTGTILETARLKQIIGQIMDMDLRSIDAYVMGEHGESMMVPWSHVRAGGKPFVEIIHASGCSRAACDWRMTSYTRLSRASWNSSCEKKCALRPSIVFVSAASARMNENVVGK